MKTPNPRHAELPESSERPDLLVGGTRRRGQRRRYLYEIEFFDAGHTGSLRASIRNDRVSDGYGELLDDDVIEDSRPRDPRLRMIITAAANGWVIGFV